MFSRFDPKFMKDNDDTCHYLTGLSWSVFDIVCSYYTIIKITTYKYSTLKSNPHRKILDLFYTKLHFLMHWQDLDIRHTVPTIFKQHFPRLSCIIDWFEICIDRPVNLKARAQVYSNYKKHSTVKYLISCSPLGAINFLSNGWGGHATDTYIVRKSGFIRFWFFSLPWWSDLNRKRLCEPYIKLESVPKFLSKNIFGGRKTLHCKLECHNLYLHITIEMVFYPIWVLFLP